MVHGGHQRMQRLPSVQFVVRIDRIDLDNLIANIFDNELNELYEFTPQKYEYFS